MKKSFFLTLGCLLTTIVTGFEFFLMLFYKDYPDAELFAACGLVALFSGVATIFCWIALGTNRIYFVSIAMLFWVIGNITSIKAAGKLLHIDPETLVLIHSFIFLILHIGYRRQKKYNQQQNN